MRVNVGKKLFFVSLIYEKLRLEITRELPQGHTGDLDVKDLALS